MDRHAPDYDEALKDLIEEGIVSRNESPCGRVSYSVTTKGKEELFPRN